LGVPKDPFFDGSDVAGFFALQIHPQATAGNRAEFPDAKKRGQPLQQTFFYPADLGALCASVVKSSSSATSSDNQELKLSPEIG
jgi:hypothetical protein